MFDMIKGKDRLINIDLKIYFIEINKVQQDMRENRKIIHNGWKGVL